MIALAIGARLAVFTAIALTATKTRPSTLMRVAEDGVVGVGRSAKNLVRRTKNEYHARMYARATEHMRREDERFEGMTPAQRKEATADQAEILRRSAEILAQRAKPRRSSSAGREATA